MREAEIFGAAPGLFQHKQTHKVSNNAYLTGDVKQTFSRKAEEERSCWTGRLRAGLDARSGEERRQRDQKWRWDYMTMMQ